MTALLQVLLDQRQVIVFVWQDAKRKTIADAEDADYVCSLTRAELDVFEASGIEVKIPIRRKWLTPESIVRIAIEDGHRIDVIINPEAYLSQCERNQSNNQNVPTYS